MSTVLNRKFSDIKKKIRYFKYFNFFDPFTSPPDKKFLIYTRGRTGSTVLTDLLNSHPEMFCDYEIFNTLNNGSPVRYPLKYIDSCSKRATLNKKSVYGFKVKVEQLKNEHNYKNINGLFKSLIEKGWKIIYLNRTNIFYLTISGMISNQSNIFHMKKAEELELKKINIDCQLLLGIMNYYEELDRLEEESLKSLHHIRLNYEEDLLDNSKHQSTSNKVFEYIGIENFPVNTKLKKIIPENLENIILNYGEVYNFVSKTKFSNYL